jgi:hypothetical protein
MAISHICMSCGLDLARLHPRPDPHYGLPIVVCPRCATAVVRRAHPLVVRWREARRLRGAMRAMGLRAAVGAALMAASVGMVFLVEAGAKDLGVSAFELPRLIFLGRDGAHRLPEEAPVMGGVLLGLWVLLQIGVGVLLSAGLRHWGRAIAWGVWAGLLVLMLSLVPASYPVRAAMGLALDDPIVYDGPAWGLWAERVTIGLGALLVSPAGIPVGAGLRLAREPLRRWKFRFSRRMLRRARGHDR